MIFGGYCLRISTKNYTFAENNINAMKISLVSFYTNLQWNERISIVANIVNTSSADLIVFAGHTLRDHAALEQIKGLIKNIHTFVLLEVKKDQLGPMCSNKHSLYLIQHGETHSLHTHQMFATHEEIEGNVALAAHFLHELRQRRTFEIDERGKCLVLQCGELNILKNLQSDNNRVIFRLEDNQSLKKDFEDILQDVKYIINPIHTPMGNQGKMKKRREYLSARNKCYCSVSNSPNKEFNNVVTYSYFNGKPWEPSTNPIVTKGKYKEISIEL